MLIATVQLPRCHLRDEFDGDLKKVTTETGATLRAKQLILATGARWRRMNVPGEEEYRNKGVTFCPHCDGPLFKGKKVAVIGGGNSGVEAAIDGTVLVDWRDRTRIMLALRLRRRSLPSRSGCESGRGSGVSMREDASRCFAFCTSLGGRRLGPKGHEAKRQYTHCMTTSLSSKNPLGSGTASGSSSSRSHQRSTSGTSSQSTSVPSTSLLVLGDSRFSAIDDALDVVE